MPSSPSSFAAAPKVAAPKVATRKTATSKIGKPSTAHSNETNEDETNEDETNEDEPVIWINEIRGTRIFGTTIGHHNETMLDEKYQSILADGWKWATGK